MFLIMDSLIILNFGVQPCIQQVHQNIDGKNNKCCHHDIGDDHGVVGFKNGHQQQVAHARPLENGFRDNGKRDEFPDALSCYCVHGNEHVAQGMLDNDRERGQSLGPGGFDVFL